MKRIMAIVLAVAWCVIPVMGQSAGVPLAERASQFYARGEWASSLAAYRTLAHDNGTVAAYHVRAIVSALMEKNYSAARDETLAGIDCHVPIDTIFAGVFSESIAQGKCDMYEKYISGMKVSDAWLARVVDRCLLKYYVFRNDPGRIVETATLLLESTPDNMLFLPALAYGQLLSGDLEGMAATSRRILELDSHNLDALLYLANYRYGQWRSGNAEAKAEALEYTSRAERRCKTPQLERMLAELQR